MARDYKKEYRTYHASEKQKHNRALRNAARNEMEDEGRVHKGDNKDVDHKRPLITGGSNRDENLRVVSRSANRSYRRNSKGRPL